MKNIELLQKVADLVGFKFSSVSYTFAEVELDGGVMITNSTEGEFVLGDTISVKNEDGTFTQVGSGTHRLADGMKIFITDEEGKLVEIKDAMEDETEDEGVVIVDAEKEKMESGQLDALKAAIHDVLFAFEAHTKEIADLKADLQAFKKEAKHNPLKEDILMSNAFSSDSRYEILKQMKLNK
jgi:co-chaperonin GroES (HSP10)